MHNREIDAGCKVCGKPIPSRNKYHCSKECATKSAWTVKICDYCAKGYKARACYTQRGQMRFCSHQCSALANRKYPVQIFDGVRFHLSVHGYYHNPRKRIKLHRYVWEHYNGPIPEGCVIHHIDHDKTNNVIENLQLMEWGEHTAHHNRGKNRSKPKAPCAVKGCKSPSRARKKCTKHYQQEMAKERGKWL